MSAVNAKTTVYRGGGMSIDWYGEPPAIGTEFAYCGERVKYEGHGPAGTLLVRGESGIQNAAFPHELSEVS